MSTNQFRKLTGRSTDNTFPCCRTDYSSALCSERMVGAYKNIHRMSLLESLGGRMNRILGYAVSFHSFGRVCSSCDSPLSIAFLAHSSDCYLSALIKDNLSGNIPIPGCRRHISKSTILARILIMEPPADLYDVWTISLALSFLSLR
jgi:hypothetical protein